MSAYCLNCGSPMTARRSTRKYCSDNCKQLAFYKRTAFLQSGMPDGPPSFTEDQPPDDDLNASDTNNVFALPETYSPAKPSRPLSAPSVNIGMAGVEKEAPYQVIQSRFLERVVEYTDSGKHSLMFQAPEKYWSSYTLPDVRWVSVRFRCLLENLIWLSNTPAIDNATLAALKEAFTELVESQPFRHIASEYPHTELIKEIQQKITAMAKEYKHQKVIPFRLSFNRKAELIAKRFAMADFVPFVRFKELDFSK